VDAITAAATAHHALGILLLTSAAHRIKFGQLLGAKVRDGNDIWAYNGALVESR